MSHEWWVFLGLFLLGMGFLFFLKKMFPIPQEEKNLAGSWQELERRYRKWDVLGGILGILLGVAGGYAIWWVCRGLCTWRAHGLEGAHVLVPHAGMCLIPVVPAAIATGIAGAWILLHLLLRSRFQELAAYGSLKLGVHTTRLLATMFFLCAGLTGIGMALTVDTYMALSDQKLTYNPFLGVKERVYSYADIASIQQVFDIKSRFKTDVTIHIHFKDGEVWKSGNTAELSSEQARIIATYVEEHAGVSVEKKTLRRKYPLLSCKGCFPSRRLVESSPPMSVLTLHKRNYTKIVHKYP
jgi:hypothetical protein